MGRKKQELKRANAAKWHWYIAWCESRDQYWGQKRDFDELVDQLETILREVKQ